MNSPEYRRFAHKSRKFNSPANEARVRAVADIVHLQPQDEVIDLGCGTGEWLLRLLAPSTARGLGVDTDGLALEEAARRAEELGLSDRVEWLESEAGTALENRDSRFTVAVCVGASHAFGGFVPFLREVSSILRPGGSLLLGEGFWERQPSDEYVTFLGDLDLGSFTGPIEVGAELGWECLWATSATLDEWDYFEWEFFRVAYEYARDNPQDDQAASLLESRRRWREAYLRWGRGTMGFGYYVFTR